MKNNGIFFSPDNSAILYRILSVLSLCLFWIRSEGSVIGLFFLFSIIITNLFRWRSKGLKFTLILDQIFCIGASIFWEEAAFGLTLAVFDSVFLAAPVFLMPALIYALFYARDHFLIFMLLQGLFVGFALGGWRKQKQEAFEEINYHSKKRYELESLRKDLIIANVQVSRMAEISERSRIAREIHDNAGHEIIAAYMSLQVIDNLLEGDNEAVKDMFNESLIRLEKGIEKIREAVHNLAPLKSMGADYLSELCKEFTMCPIEFEIFGDTSKVPIYLWSILEPTLKEALTNIVRHSRAEKVEVTLDVTPYILRLSVENDGVEALDNENSPGIGLRNLRYRARTIGGNISVDTVKGFRLICVLPMNPAMDV